MEKESDNQQVLLRYLIELRKRLIYCFIVLLIIFTLLLYFANDFYTFIAFPLLKFLPNGHGLIATHVVSSFFVPFKLTWIVSLFIAAPFFLYQSWAFIAPGLYKNERRLIWPLLCISTMLFYTGTAFAYFVVSPLLFGFLTHSVPQGVTMSPDIAQYLDFVLNLFFVFGVIFEVPVLTILLIWTKVTTREKLIRFRPYAIVLAFIISMFFAPPDVISQTLLAVPLWLLYELGILLAPLFLRIDTLLE